MSSTKTRRKAKQRQQARKLNTALVGIVVVAIGIVGYVLLTTLTGTGSIGSSPAGAVAPSSALVTLEGSTVIVPDTSRQATVIYSMAYWCGTCIPEARALAQLEREFSGNLRVVNVDIDPSSTPERLRDFIAAVGENNMDWVFDTNGSVSQKYDIRVLDATIIFDGAGREVYRDGYSTLYDVLRNKLQEIITT